MYGLYRDLEIGTFYINQICAAKKPSSFNHRTV